MSYIYPKKQQIEQLSPMEVAELLRSLGFIIPKFEYLAKFLIQNFWVIIGTDGGFTISTQDEIVEVNRGARLGDIGYIMSLTELERESFFNTDFDFTVLHYHCLIGPSLYHGQSVLYHKMGKPMKKQEIAGIRIKRLLK
jgi:hypothetical protein